MGPDNKVDYKKQGRANRRKGAAFELKVRRGLEADWWIVDRWTNNVIDGKLQAAKSNRFNSRTTGFPDFLAFSCGRVIGIECKSGPKPHLDRVERDKVAWYKRNAIFSSFYMATEAGFVTL